MYQEPLTKRQEEILFYYAKDKSPAQIAQYLGIKEKTVWNQLDLIRQKIHHDLQKKKTQRHFIKYAVDSGLIKKEDALDDSTEDFGALSSQLETNRKLKAI